jgi:prevent-host-death family protein
MAPNMREIGAFEAKNTLGALLDLVERGEEIVITRRSRPVARLIRETESVDREKARQAAADILAASKGVTLGDLKLKDLIDEGRA